MFHGIGSSLFYIWFNFVKDIFLFKKILLFFCFLLLIIVCIFFFDLILLKKAVLTLFSFFLSFMLWLFFSSFLLFNSFFLFTSFSTFPPYLPIFVIVPTNLTCFSIFTHPIDVLSFLLHPMSFSSLLYFKVKARLFLSYCSHWPLLLPLYTTSSRLSSLWLLLCFHFTLPAILNLLNAPTVLFSQSSPYITSAGLPSLLLPLSLLFCSPSIALLASIMCYLHCPLLIFTLARTPTGLPS